MRYNIFNIICIILINTLFFLAINTNQIFAYILITFLFLLLSFGLKKILDSQNFNKENNDSRSKDSKETAEDHPIIRSARKRLGSNYFFKNSLRHLLVSLLFFDNKCSTVPSNNM